MAISVVGTPILVTGLGNSGAFTNVSLAGLGLQEGDLVVVMCLRASGSNSNITTPSGYTDISEQHINDGNYTVMKTYRKFMGSTPDSTITQTMSGNAVVREVLRIIALRGVDTSTPMDVSAVTVNAINGSALTRSDITPTTPGAFVYAIMGGSSTSAQSPSTNLPSSGTRPLVRDNGIYDSRALYGYCGLLWASGAVSDGPNGTGGTNTSIAGVKMVFRPSSNNLDEEYSDGVEISESQLNSIGGKEADGTALTENLTANLSIKETEGVNIAENELASVAKSPLSEVVGMSEYVGRSISQIFSDGVGIDEEVTDMIIYQSIIDDDEVIATDILGPKTVTQVFVESMVLEEHYDDGTNASDTVGDAVSVTDVQIKTISQTFSEGVGMTDEFDGVRDLSGGYDEGVEAGEVFANHISQYFSESIGLSESLTKVVLFHRTYTEVVIGNEFITRGIIKVPYTDGIAMADDVNNYTSLWDEEQDTTTIWTPEADTTAVLTNNG